MADAAANIASVTQIREDLRKHGYAIYRQLLSSSAVERARKHLEAVVERHLSAAEEVGELVDVCAGLPFEQRLATAYSQCPEHAPCSWVPQVKHSFAFQQLLFRDAALISLIEALTGQEALLAERFNCRAKLPAAASASFPWHQDHAFFRMQYLFKKQPAKRLLAVWAPLVPVDVSNGGVRIAPGSHRLGFLRHIRQGGFLAASLPEAAPPVLAGPVPPLEPGDVLLFTDLTLHSSGANTTTGVRWSADWAFELPQGDELDETLSPPLESGTLARQEALGVLRALAETDDDGAGSALSRGLDKSSKA